MQPPLRPGDFFNACSRCYARNSNRSALAIWKEKGSPRSTSLGNPSPLGLQHPAWSIVGRNNGTAISLFKSRRNYFSMCLISARRCFPPGTYIISGTVKTAILPDSPGVNTTAFIHLRLAHRTRTCKAGGPAMPGYQDWVRADPPPASSAFPGAKILSAQTSRCSSQPQARFKPAVPESNGVDR